MLSKPRFTSLYAAALTGIFIVLSLTGCPATMNPNAAALEATPENMAVTQAYASYGEWTIVHEQIAELVCGPATPTSRCPGNPAIPTSVVRQVQAIDDRATKVEPQLLSSITLVQSIQAQLAAGQTPTEKLEIANANMLKWSTDLQGLIAEMKTASGR